MQNIAFALIVLTGAWFVAASVLMAFRPGQALHILSRTASTRLVNNLEQGLRLLAGVALIVRAPVALWPTLFQVGGGFVVVSSLLLLLLPLKLHAGYAIWWARSLPYWAVRAIAPLSVAAGVTLIFAAK